MISKSLFSKERSKFVKNSKFRLFYQRRFDILSIGIINIKNREKKLKNIFLIKSYSTLDPQYAQKLICCLSPISVPQTGQYFA